jgi:RNA polymerase sigma-70 factor (ECF subfamily)
MEMSNRQKKNKLAADDEIFALVHRAKKGDEIAFKELMSRYEKSIFYMILKMVKNEADAEDLTIEVFTKVFYNIDMYTETHSFSTWLFKIASNHAIDFLRRRKNQQNDIKIDEPLNAETNWYFELASDEPNPENMLIIKQHEDEVKQLMSVLPEDLRIALKMRIYDDMSYKEIAQKLDIAIGTVKARLFRARNLLATIIRRAKRH